ncbi:hypothetical protein [Accumulibacter sp.]|uniref:hypothetical protein n=1 Tax=Accumulibacter sp. TaxID=2053492 RepID=UPI0025D34F76|nr:hypothetical protein [Accumulibacter sp.]MCM8613911.1 hypothetical protein [Accumulibacter sp.]MCM8637702.1 hypothetical protein [Accumulibacter sp.]MCM8641084.1 hypothetical protein [Accumulibacter sp.]
MSGSRRPPQRSLAVAALSVLLLGCSPRVSLDQFNRLRTGQSYEEVREIVGDPASCDEMIGLRHCVWGTPERGIRVGFLGGKVVLLSAHNLQ